MENTTKAERGDRPPILWVRGFPYPGHELYTRENVESALDYVPQGEDIFIVTYPKSGTTWLTYIVWEILNKGAPLPSMVDMNYKLIPYLEMCGASKARILPRPRVFKYHSNYQLIPKSPDAKYIYLYRNPKDVCVSRFFFTQEIYARDLNFDHFVELFVSGRLAHGSWFDHVASWAEHGSENNILFLSYEELLEDTRGSILRLAEFLGGQFKKQLEDTSMMDAILKHTSFQYMKHNLPVAVPSREDPGKFRKINFFRKGSIGDWKNYMSAAQSQMFDQMTCDRLGHTDLIVKS